MLRAGQVPVLAWKSGGKDKSVYESLICNEFVEDKYPEHRMMPSDPYEKARCKLIIDRYGNNFIPAFYKSLMQQDKGVQVRGTACLSQRSLIFESIN